MRIWSATHALAEYLVLEGRLEADCGQLGLCSFVLGLEAGCALDGGTGVLVTHQGMSSQPFRLETCSLLLPQWTAFPARAGPTGLAVQPAYKGPQQCSAHTRYAFLGP